MSQTLYISAVPGVTSAKLFTTDTDTVVATAASVTAGTNDPSWYTIVFNPDVASASYRVVLYISTSAVASADVTVGDGAIDINGIAPSDPGKRTGYVVCYSQNGVVESGVVVSCQCYYAPDTGLALDTRIRTATSDIDGLAQFTNMIVGAKYKLRRGSDPHIEFTVPAGTGPFAMDSIVGQDE